MFLGRKSRNTRLDSVAVVFVSGSVTTRGRRGVADMRGLLVSEARERARGRCGSWASPRECEREREEASSAPMAQPREKRVGSLGQASRPPTTGKVFFFLFLFFSHLNLFPKPF
jgi:hypothetical protein